MRRPVRRGWYRGFPVSFVFRRAPICSGIAHDSAKLKSLDKAPTHPLHVLRVADAFDAIANVVGRMAAPNDGAPIKRRYAAKSLRRRYELR